ncbi:MAG: hypothetical protein M0Z47_06790 [Actinomycetota bacterium]|nr:hypothetical protein [Actinomycetota bacterium]
MKLIGYDVSCLPVRWDHVIEWQSETGQEWAIDLLSAALNPELNATTTIRGTDYMVMRGGVLELPNQIFFVATYPDRIAHYAALFVDPESHSLVSDLNQLFHLKNVGTADEMATATVDLVPRAPAIVFVRLLSTIPESTQTEIEQLILQLGAAQCAP